MNCSNSIYVRVDYYKNGDMAPISFVDENKSTQYIRKIIKIVRESSPQYTDTVYFLCITRSNNIVTLSLKNNIWYIK